MTEKAPLQAFVAAFADEDGASRALKQLYDRDKDLVGVEQAAVLVRNADGDLEIREAHHTGRGAVVGGLVGGVIGLITGPVGWAAAIGGAVGALGARLRDSGFPDDRLRTIGEALSPGTSAVVAIVEQRWVQKLEEDVRAEGAEYATEAVRAEVAAQLEETRADIS